MPQVYERLVINYGEYSNTKRDAKETHIAYGSVNHISLVDIWDIVLKNWSNVGTPHKLIFSPF